MVLELHDPKWNDLRHAYGAASDIPPLIRAVSGSGDQRQQAWEKLWSSLCHQDTVYSATYAALPHLVRMATDHPTLRADVLVLIGAVEARARLEGDVPEEIMRDYLPALLVARAWSKDAVLAVSPAEIRDGALPYLLQGYAALRDPASPVAKYLHLFDDSEIDGACPSCGRALAIMMTPRGIEYGDTCITPDRSGYEALIERGRQAVDASLDPGWDETTGPWQLAALAEACGAKPLANMILDQFAVIPCTTCGALSTPLAIAASLDDTAP